ncbi:MAG: FRG domain-containing protein [Cyanobacteria bacterium J06639_14]
MATTYKVSSNRDALALAHQFRREGRYDWFRGQVSSEWSVVPSLLRDGVDLTSAEKRLDRFFGWVQSTRGLEAIASDETAMYAVAQHYGIPTHFVDFTTDPDVAAFFAFDTTREIPPGSLSSIVCLDTKDLLRVALPDDMPKPFCERIHVPDLWRLIAQSGVFLVCPYKHFEQVVYPFDRIIFPHGGDGLEIVRDWVYPHRKSQIEIALAHFFADERQRCRIDDLMAQFRTAHYFSIPESGTYWSSAIKAQINPLQSWAPELVHPWAALPDEQYNDVALPSICVDLRNLALPPREANKADRQAIVEEVLSQLNGTPELRSTRATWSLVSPPLSSHGDLRITQLSTALERLWDGLRRLPLNNGQLAKSVETCIAFWTFAEILPAGSLSIDDWATDKVLGVHRWVEIGGAGGSSRSCVSRDKLIAALRPDMEDFIIDQFRNQFLTDPSVIVEWAWKVEYLYDFLMLGDALATEMVPYQVLFRPEDPVFFSPTRIERIGC